MYPAGYATKILTEGPATAGLEDVSGRTSSPASRPWSENCSRNAGRTSPCSAKGFSAASHGDANGARPRSRVRVIGAPTCANATASRCPRATSTYPRAAPRRAGLYRAMKETAKRLRGGDDLEAAMAGGAELITAAGLHWIISRHVMRRRSRRSNPSRMDRSGCWSPRRSATQG